MDVAGNMSKSYPLSTFELINPLLNIYFPRFACFSERCEDYIDILSVAW